MAISLNTRGRSFIKTILKKKNVLSQLNQFLIPSLRTSVALAPYIFNHHRQPFTLQGGAFFLSFGLWMNEGRLCLCFLGCILRGCLTLWCAYWYETFYCPHFLHTECIVSHALPTSPTSSCQCALHTYSLHLYIQINTPAVGRGSTLKTICPLGKWKGGKGVERSFILAHHFSKSWCCFSIAI